jgi:hypothetical protein
MSTFYLKKGDRLPVLQRTLYGADGVALNLTGATVTFSMRPSGSATLKVTDGACVLSDAAGGVVQYEWGATDSDTAGSFVGEFRATIGGKQLSVPNRGTILVEIADRLS